MEDESDLIRISKYIDNLIQASLELRSKLTSVILATECSEQLSDQAKALILKYTDSIEEKDDALVFTERQLQEVFERLQSGEKVGDIIKDS